VRRRLLLDAESSRGAAEFAAARHVASQCCCCCCHQPAAAAHHECWSLNGQNRLGAHEWPGGGRHFVVLLRRPQHSSLQPAPPGSSCYPSSRFWLSVGELSGLVLLLVMRAPSGSGQVQPWVVAAW